MSKETDQFEKMAGEAIDLWRTIRPKQPKAKIRNITIESVKYEGSWACDVVVTRMDESKEVYPTKLYQYEQTAIGEAKRIKNRLLHDG